MVVAEGAVYKFLVVVSVKPAGFEPSGKEHIERFLVGACRGRAVQLLAVGSGNRRYIFWALEASFYL